jgi:hypothetical protein
MNVGDADDRQLARGIATGTVISVHSQRTDIESKGKQIFRNKTADDSAVIIHLDTGTPVVKIAHELQVIKGGSNV